MGYDGVKEGISYRVVVGLLIGRKASFEGSTGKGKVFIWLPKIPISASTRQT